jgi:hypothetical protein
MKDLNYGDGYLYNPAFACVIFRRRLIHVLSRVGCRWGCRHPVYQEYTPPLVSGSDILLPEGAKKEWDEKLLLQWEYRANKGREWEGRGG